MDIFTDSELILAGLLTVFWFIAKYRDSVKKSVSRGTGDFVGGKWE